MKVQLLTITPNAEDLIEQCGRVCYQSEPKEGYAKGTLIRALIKSGHQSVLEHASATFLIDDISRSLSHQLVRHRLASYSQKSQRYVKEDQFQFVVPSSIKELGESTLRPAKFGINRSNINWAVELFEKQMHDIQRMYNVWKEYGIKNEDARFVLPNACTTEIAMTANFREWRKIIELRCDSHAQWEIQELGKAILFKLHQEAPNVFGDQYEYYIVGL